MKILSIFAVTLIFAIDRVVILYRFKLIFK